MVPRASGKEIGARLLAFAIPVLIAVEVPGLGTIYLAELCLIGLLPVLVVMRGKALQSRSLAFILLLGLVYFGAQVITDVFRETPFSDYARGWSRILFLLLSFVSCYLLIGGNRARILCYAGGLVVGATIYLLLQNPLSAIGWKFGFAGPTTTLLLMSFALVPVLRSPSSLVGPVIMLALGAFSAFMNYRSWGGILMISAAFLSVPAILRLFGLKPRPLTYGRMVVVGALLLGTAFGALKLYGVAAESGALGEKSREKYETQSALGDLGILLGGRSESLVTVQAIQDSPLIGHGSWAKDRYYAELRQLMLYRLGFVNRFIEPENDLIPTHSHLLGAWVEAGLGGAIFWLGMLAMIIAALRRLYASDDPLRPYLVFVMFLFIWDILFSPFGAQRRLTNGFLMVVVIYALRTSAMGWHRRVAQLSPYAPPLNWTITEPVDRSTQSGLEDSAGRSWLVPPRRRAEPALEERRWQDMDSDGDDRTDETGAFTTDLGAGGETIRAGFRRLRQRKR